MLTVLEKLSAAWTMKFLFSLGVVKSCVPGAKTLLPAGRSKPTAIILEEFSRQDDDCWEQKGRAYFCGIQKHYSINYPIECLK